MNKEDILKILEGAKDKNGDIPMRLVRKAFEKLPEQCTDTISRQSAIDAVKKNRDPVFHDSVYYEDTLYDISNLPSVQSEQPEIQDILDYMDTVLHPIISTEYWNVYSELHDMISTLPYAQPEPAIPLQWIEAQIEWLKSKNNAFSIITAGQIMVLVNKWKDEQDGRHDK